MTKAVGEDEDEGGGGAEGVVVVVDSLSLSLSLSHLKLLKLMPVMLRKLEELNQDLSNQGPPQQFPVAAIAATTK